jgi:hypothetical protein
MHPRLREHLKEVTSDDGQTWHGNLEVGDRPGKPQRRYLDGISGQAAYFWQLL